MDWGRTGHQVVGALAQQYLTPKAHKRGRRIVGWSFIGQYF